MGLHDLPEDIQNTVRLAVVEGEVQAEHKINNLMGDLTLTGVHKRRAETQTQADGNDHEDHDMDHEGVKKEEDVKDEHKPKKWAGVIRKDREQDGLLLSPSKDLFGRQLRGGRGGASSRGRGGAKFLRGKAAQYRGLPVCHICQSNAHANKDCRKTRTNKSVANLGAFAPGLLPHNV